MKPILKISLLALSVGLSSSVMANGFYIGANAGYNKMDAEGNKYSQDNKAAGGFQAGYLHPINANMLLGGEFGIDTLGKIKLGKSNSNIWNTIHRSAINLQLVGKYLIDDFNVFAKAGATKQFGKYTLGGTKVIDNSKVAPIAGLGIGYNLTQNIEVTAEYSHVFGKTLGSNDWKADDAITQDTFKIVVNYLF